MSTLDVTVALFIYNRPEHTRRVFARIRAAAPARLFVIADGAKDDADTKAVHEARKATETVDWPCGVEREYADSNLGLGRRVAAGIETVLDLAGEAMFLEDDCLPEASFFQYCADLLARYREMPEVMMITGFNPLAAGELADPSYNFTRFGSIWGWATWRRAFEGYSLEPPAASDTATFDRLRAALRDDRAFDYYRRALAQVRNSAVDTWDYQWTVHRLLRGGLCAVPRRNLVENIGFSCGTTHSSSVNPLLLGLDTRPLEFPLRHPPRIGANPTLDERLLRHRFGEPWSEDLNSACERLLQAGRIAPLLALAAAGRARYPNDKRFVRLRIQALERLGQHERARQERDESADGDRRDPPSAVE